MVVGIYSDVSGDPTALLAGTSGKLVAGINELSVPEVALPAGTYWFMMGLRTSTTRLYRSDANQRPLKYVTRTFSTSPPATYPAIYNEQDESQRNVYLVLGR